MKEKINALTKIVLSIVLCTILFFVHSCKKESELVKNLPENESQTLERYFNANFNTSKSNPFARLSPIWNDIYITEQNDEIVYEVPLNNSERIFCCG